MANEARNRPKVSPPKPVLVFDGKCALCAAWVGGLRRRKGPELECVAYQDASVSVRFPNLAHERWEHSVHLIQADGHIYSGVQAMLRTPGGGRSQAALLWLYRRLPAFAGMAESVYCFVAANRRWLNAPLPGRRRERPPLRRVRS